MNSSLSRFLPEDQRKSFFFSQHLATLAEKKPEQQCLHRGQLTTAEKVWDDVLRAATWMQRNGVERGSVVFFGLSADHPDAQTLLMAASHVGAAVSIAPAHPSEARLAQIASQISPACVFLDSGTASFRAHLESTLTVWMSPGLSQGDWDEVELDEVFSTLPAWGLPFPGQTDDTALMLFRESEDTPAEVWTHRRLCEESAMNSDARLQNGSHLTLPA